MRTRLLEALSAVLEESAGVVKHDSPGRKTPCSHHSALVSALKPKDTIISFNYDCVVDHALRISPDRKWSARYGYGFPNPARVEGTAAWDCANPPNIQNKSVNLLKLHGSLNWFPFPDKDSGPIKLRQRPYKQKGQKLYEIVPPEYVKSVGSRPIFPTLWSHAELAIRKAKKIALIGFSFTQPLISTSKLSSDSHSLTSQRSWLSSSTLSRPIESGSGRSSRRLSGRGRESCSSAGSQKLPRTSRTFSSSAFSRSTCDARRAPALAASPPYALRTRRDVALRLICDDQRRRRRGDRRTRGHGPARGVELRALASVPAGSN
jgi:hypothetical protein